MVAQVTETSPGDRDDEKHLQAVTFSSTSEAHRRTQDGLKQV